MSPFVLGDSEEPINFFSFTEEMVNSSVMTLTRRGRKIAEVDGNKILNWTFYALDFLGMIAGSFFAHHLVIGDRKYCDNCKRYMKHKKLLNFSASDDEKLTRFKTISTVEYQDIAELIKNDATSCGADYYEVDWHYCDECNCGLLQLQYMKHSIKKASYISKKSFDIPLTSSVTNAIKQLS